MDKEWEKVRAFHQKFGHPAPEMPCALTRERVEKRYVWMLEELDEFMAAESMVDQADAMLDLMYFALGTMVEMGIRPGRLFDAVHQANMAKLWPDGKPHYNAMGKTIKPSTWQPPEPVLQALIQEQNG